MFGTPANPSAPMRRSTVQRATCSPGYSRAKAFHIFRTPYTPRFAACTVVIRSSQTASVRERADGGRDLRA
ncbi:hypothetical protein GCM10027418_04630 [Mariniluteicoccus endophyticus]